MAYQSEAELELQFIDERLQPIETVSYTHLTLPTT